MDILSIHGNPFETVLLVLFALVLFLIIGVSIIILMIRYETKRLYYENSKKRKKLK